MNMTGRPTTPRTAGKLIRFRPDELTAVAERARVCGVPVARYIREAALGVPRRTQGNAELIRQLARIGNNLNQLARAANTGTQVGEDLRLRVVLEDVIAMIRRVE